jgi:hypothetical protein
MDVLKPNVLKPDVLKPDVLKPDVLKPDGLWVYHIYTVEGNLGTDTTIVVHWCLCFSLYLYVTLFDGANDRKIY